MTEELINMNDEYETRDGREVRVLCVDREDKDYPVIALVKYDVHEYSMCFTATGKSLARGSKSCMDLVKRPKFRPGDVWLCRDGKTKVEILRTDLKGTRPIAGIATYDLTTYYPPRQEVASFDAKGNAPGFAELSLKTKLS